MFGLPFLASRLGLYASAAAALVIAGAVLLHQHDNRVRAEMQVAQDRAIAAAQADNQRRVNIALTGLQAAQAQRDAALAAARRTINAAPVTTSCSRAPAVRAALDSLRPASGAGPTPAHP